MTRSIRVAVSGIGNMGEAVIAAVETERDMEIVGVLTSRSTLGDHQSISGLMYPQYADPVELFDNVHVEVVVDFTHASFTNELVDATLASGVRLVIGTSGVSLETIERLRDGCVEQNLGAVIAPNFSEVAVLFMHQARLISSRFDFVEIIEYHGEHKLDAPSGTALEIARQMRDARGRDFERGFGSQESRGVEYGGIAIHSVRMPGFVARQDVIFSRHGETFTLSHNSTGRDSFIPGVLLAILEVTKRNKLFGFDEILGLLKLA